MMMKKPMGFPRHKIAMAILCTIVGCSEDTSKRVETSEGSGTVASSFAPAPSNFRLSLTDAPKEDLKEVNVNVHHIELFLGKGAVEKRLILANGLGMVNLLDLQNGVILPLADVNMPEGVEISQIRLVLNGDNNHVIRKNDQRCDLQTPSGQQSGIKILIKNPIVIESGYRYSMIVDFDAAKSVVIRGNGSCLLKPVLKLSAATRQPVESNDDDGQDDDSVEPIVDGSDSNVPPAEDSGDPTEEDIPEEDASEEELGFDPLDPSTYPDGITPDDLAEYFK